MTTQRYISKELVHFVGKGFNEEDQYKLLIKILHSGWLTHPPHNPNISGNLTVSETAKISCNDMYSPQIICFCDIPQEDLSLHVEKYSPFGLSFTKDFIVHNGGVPVHYIPKSSKVRFIKNLDPAEMSKILEKIGQDGLYDFINKGDYFDKMMSEYHYLFRILRSININNPPENYHHRLMELMKYFDFHIFSYFKFYDHTLSDNHKDNYYFEREWRVLGNIRFSLEEVKTIYLPEKFAKRFRTDLPEYYAQLIFIK